MKIYIVVLSSALIIFTGVAYAGGPYTVLWFTEDEDPSTGICDVSPALLSTYYVRVWIYNNPVDGFISCMLGVDSGNDIINSITRNPDMPINITEGNYAFPECRYDQWVWLFSCELVHMGTPTRLRFTADSNTGNFNISTCRTDGYPVEELTAGNEFGVNQDCVTDADISSWGVVKSIYR